MDPQPSSPLTPTLTLTQKIQHLKDDHNQKKSTYQFYFLSIFLTFASIGFLIYKTLPPLSPTEKTILLQIPTEIETYQQMIGTLKVYASQNTAYMILVFSYLYIFFMTFALPLTSFLIIASPTLFGTKEAFIISWALSAVGPTCAYIMSRNILRGWIISWKPTWVLDMCTRVESQQGNLFFYMMFLRVNPLFPNTLINMTAPIADVPLFYFFFGTLFGLIPLIIVNIQIGMQIDNVTEMGISMESF
jgi:uncharacterized membrane protein YdjX (TVP38/TMEM64 family)